MTPLQLLTLARAGDWTPWVTQLETLMTDTMILNKVLQSREMFNYLIVGENHHSPSDNIITAGSCVCAFQKPVDVTLYANIFSFH